MSVKKVAYYIIHSFQTIFCWVLPAKKEASLTVKVSRRTVADSMRCSEKKHTSHFPNKKCTGKTHALEKGLSQNVFA